jgi:hypothetical protein
MCQTAAAARVGVPGSRYVKPRSYAVKQPVDFDSTKCLLSSGSGPLLMHDERGSTRARVCPSVGPFAEGAGARGISWVRLVYRRSRAACHDASNLGQ